MNEKELFIESIYMPLEDARGTQEITDQLIRRTIMETLKRTTKKKRGKEHALDETQLLVTLNSDEETRRLNLVEVVMDLEEAMKLHVEESEESCTALETGLVELSQSATVTIGEVIATAQRLLCNVFEKKRTA